MSKKKFSVMIMAICLITQGSTVFACGVEGSVRRTDGSKVNGTETVSTSWNSQKGYPRDGWYSIELGSSACKENVTVYVGGNTVQEVKLPSNGNARVDILLKGATSNPVR